MISKLTLHPEALNTPVNKTRFSIETAKRKDLRSNKSRERDRELITSSDRRKKKKKKKKENKGRT